MSSKCEKGGDIVFTQGKMETQTGIGGGNLKHRGHLEDVVIDGRIILKMIQRNINERR